MAFQPQKLAPGQVVTVYTLDFTKAVAFVPTVNPILRLSAYRNGNSDIVFASNTYSYVGVLGTGFRSEANGTAAKPNLQFDKASLYANADFQSLKADFQTQTGEVYFDWRGVLVTITKYYVTGNETVYQQEYLVDQVAKITKNTLEVTLTVSLGIDRLGSDSVQTLSLNRCSLRYRTWNGSGFDYTPVGDDGCPYGNPTNTTDYSAVPSFGIKFYTKEDSELLFANRQFDECSQTAKGCQLRFDPNAEGYNLPIKALLSPSSKLGE
jgi:phage-related protein